jgi:hypothetical protein
MNDYAPQDTAIVKQGFGSTEMAIQRETSATAMAARARAQIEARYVMALQRPRNIDRVRQNLLHECERPNFAESARYSLPRRVYNRDTGEWEERPIEGPTIRFAEAALRCMTNVAVEVSVISDDPKKAVLHIAVTDLEANLPYETEVSVTKTVERARLKKGQRAISERINSYGDQVYLVEATDDEVLQKTNALVSKAVRTLGLRHLPGDILEEAMDKCIATTRKKDAEDPDAARKKLLDAFYKIGVPADEIALYLGHQPSVLDPSELEELRAVFGAVRDGEATWRSVLETKTGEVPEGTKDGKEASAAQKKTQEILDKRKAEQKKRSEEKKAKPDAAKKSEPKATPEAETGQAQQTPKLAPENERVDNNPDDPDAYG